MIEADSVAVYCGGRAVICGFLRCRPILTIHTLANSHRALYTASIGNASRTACFCPAVLPGIMLALLGEGEGAEEGLGWRLWGRL